MRALQLLESRFPFGRYAEQAQLELIYAHYNNYEPAAAIEAADRFIRLHPQHPNVDYAFYMKGLAAYTQDQGLFDRWLPRDITKRDTGYAQEAFAEFAQLLARYPDSPYAPDARARMVHLRNLLARAEINVANYYFRRGAYVAALNRGRRDGAGLPAAGPRGSRPGFPGRAGAQLPGSPVAGQGRQFPQRLHRRGYCALLRKPGKLRTFRSAAAAGVRQPAGRRVSLENRSGSEALEGFEALLHARNVVSRLFSRLQ